MKIIIIIVILLAILSVKEGEKMTLSISLFLLLPGINVPPNVYLWINIISVYVLLTHAPQSSYDRFRANPQPHSPTATAIHNTTRTVHKGGSVGLVVSCSIGDDCFWLLCGLMAGCKCMNTIYPRDKIESGRANRGARALPKPPFSLSPVCNVNSTPSCYAWPLAEILKRHPMWWALQWLLLATHPQPQGSVNVVGGCWAPEDDSNNNNNRSREVANNNRQCWVKAW